MRLSTTASTDMVATWRVGERLMLPWKALADAWAARRGRRHRSSIARLTPLSMEWLRNHEIDSWKHSADP